MSARRQSGVALPVALLLACIGLVLVVYREMAANSRPLAVRTADGGASVVALPAAVRFAMAPLGDFEATVERPLFSASRRPPAAPAAAAAVAVTVAQLELVLKGVIVASGGRIAILSDKTSGATVTLGQGKLYRGWTLAEILPERVVFRRAGQEQRFTLNYDVAPKIKRPSRKRKRPNQRKRPSRQTDLDRSKPTGTDDDDDE